jgi:aspartate/methionine/tyrosine aminotransferase
MNTAKRLNGTGEYYFSQKLREIDALNAAGKQVINLGIGSPDLPPHPDVIAALQETAARSDVHAYQSYKGSPVLRKAFADWYRQWYDVELNPDTEILPLIGSKEGIMHICMTYLDEGDGVWIPNPGYPTYKSAATLAGGVCYGYDLLEENQWQPDLQQMQQQLNGGLPIKLMFVNYPHMPTGKLPGREIFEQLVAFAAANKILLVHDNPYSFILNDQPVSLLSVNGAKDHVIELNSLSKSHNLAGWRVGVLCGAAERINEILRFKSNMDSGMFLPVQLAAAKALALGTDWFEQLNQVYRERREKVFELLETVGCVPGKEQAGLFVWAKIPGTYADAYALSDEVLQNASVFLTPGGIFGTNGNGYIRISLCATVEKIEEAIRRIRNAGNKN